MTTILSEAGTVRRNAIRAAVVERMVRTRRVRRAGQAAGLAAALAVLALLGPGRGRGDADLDAHNSAMRPFFRGVQSLHDDPGIVARLRLPAAPETVLRLDDVDLLAALRQSGRAVGIVRLSGDLHLPGLAPDDWQ